MKEKKKKNIIISVFSLIMFLTNGSSIFAECSGDSCKELIERIYLHADGNIYIGTSGNEKGLSCTPSGDIYVVLKNNHLLQKEIFSTLLSAHFLNKKVWIRINPNSSPCEVVYIVTDTNLQ
jgi:hypothetical protein